MDITVKVTLTAEQWRGIEAQLRRLKGLTSVSETPEQFVSRIVQKTLDGWARSASDEFITMNAPIFNAALDKFTIAPNSAMLLAVLGMRMLPNGTLMFIEPGLASAQPGLQVGFGEPIHPFVLFDLKQFGYKIIRLNLQSSDEEAVRLRAKEIIDNQMQPLCTVRCAEQMTWLPAGSLVELGNEPDLEHEGWTPESYAAAAVDCVKVAIANPQALRLYLGAVSNLNLRGFTFLSQLPWSDYPPEICCSVHRYPEGDSPLNPHRGWPSREAEVATLKAIVGSRPLACTEVGYHNAAGGFTEEQSAENMVWERKFFSGQGFEIVSGYNINDGAGSEPIDHFGFRRLDGTWKPVAAAFAQKGDQTNG